MEVEKRKKRMVRQEVEEEERQRLKKLKEEEEHAGGGDGGEGAAVVPSEEEVEEFFAILRRMKVAVKYFDERGRRGREALEKVEITVDDGENTFDAGGDGNEALPFMKKKETEEVVVTMNNEVLDLNAMAPEADENGGE